MDQFIGLRKPVCGKVLVSGLDFRGLFRAFAASQNTSKLGKSVGGGRVVGGLEERLPDRRDERHGAVEPRVLSATREKSSEAIGCSRW